MGRLISNAVRKVTAFIYGPDRFSVQAASLGAATGTFSPMSRGVKSNGSAGFTGLPGFGVSRWAGAGDTAVQNIHGLVAPVVDPLSQRLGAGAGVSGQPGLPNTGGQSGAASSLYMLGPQGLGMGH